MKPNIEILEETLIELNNEIERCEGLVGLMHQVVELKRMKTWKKEIEKMINIKEYVSENEHLQYWLKNNPTADNIF